MFVIQRNKDNRYYEKHRTAPPYIDEFWTEQLNQAWKFTAKSQAEMMINNIFLSSTEHYTIIEIG